MGSSFDVELLIPIIAILGGISVPIVAMYFGHRKQQLQGRLIERAIEQGLTVEEIDALLTQQGMNDGASKRPSRSERAPFLRGLILLFIGAAFLITENPKILEGDVYLGGGNFMGPVGNFVGFLLGGLGLAFFVSDLLVMILGRGSSEKGE